MNTAIKITYAAILATVANSPAAATRFVGNYATTTHQSGNGLIVNTQRIAPSLNFTLDTLGASKSLDLFNIFTNEAFVDGDDRVAKLVSVAFNFSSPAFNGVLQGSTVGEGSFFGIFQNGQVTWNNGGNAIFNFGNGGQLSVHLNNTEFNNGLFGLNEGSRYGGTVKANFTLTGLAAAAPEPATWAMMLVGFGAAGYSIRRRRSTFGTLHTA